MATELYRFIKEQLSILPADHPDRLFLENRREEAKRYLKSRDKKLLTGNSFPNYLLSLKQGAFLTEEDLAKIDTDLFRSIATEEHIPQQVRHIRKDIEEHGNEALSHLCLSTRTENILARSEINTISELRAMLPFATVTIGSKSADHLKQRLNLFDQELQKSRQKPQ